MKKTIVLLLLLLMLVAGSGAATAEQYLDGYLLQLDEQYVSIEEYGGDLHQLILASGARYTIDGVQVKPEELKPGIEVYLQLRQEQVVAIEGFSAVSLGYIPPGSKVRTGVLSGIDNGQLRIKDAAGNESLYTLIPATIVLKGGKSVSPSTLYVGDRLRLYFNEVDSTVINHLEVEGDSISICAIYKGTLSLNGRFDNAISFENVKVFKNGAWQHYQNLLTLPLADGAEAFFNGQSLGFHNLQYLKGREAYLATKDYFGSERIARMVIKSNYEAVYSERIKEVNWYAEAFELANNRNFKFSPGTIVLKSGRLVENQAITPGSDAYVIADGIGSQQTASIIDIHNEGLNNSSLGQVSLYVGRLARVEENHLLLEMYSLLNQNQWEASRQQKELSYDNDTFIFDLEKGRYLSSKELFSKDYSIRKHAYLYAESDRVAAMLVQGQSDSLLRQRVTTGTIEAVEDNPYVGWTISLREAKDWSNHHRQWIARNVSLRVNLGRAMLIKGSEMIEASDLKAGDRLYLVRDDFDGRVIIVK